MCTPSALRVVVAAAVEAAVFTYAVGFNREATYHPLLAIAIRSAYIYVICCTHIRYTYIYIYIDIWSLVIYIYIHIEIERERDGEHNQ